MVKIIQLLCKKKQREKRWFLHTSLPSLHKHLSGTTTTIHFTRLKIQDILLTSVGNSKDAQIGGYDSVLAVGFLRTPPNRMHNPYLLTACFALHLSKRQFAKVQAALDLSSSKQGIFLSSYFNGTSISPAVKSFFFFLFASPWKPA